MPSSLLDACFQKHPLPRWRLLCAAILTTAWCGAAHAQTPGTADSYNPGPNGTGVSAVAVQPDGNTIIGGDFTAVSAVGRNRVARINSNGTLNAFNPNASASSQVSCVAVHPDGAVILGGTFTTLQPNGAASPTTRNRIARVDADGNLDTGFNPNANGQIHCIAIQPDGKILIGGAFTTLQPNGAASPTTRNFLARLNADGTLDTGFNPNPNNAVYSIVVQPDGKILVGGAFTASGTMRNGITRLDTNGAQEFAFNPDPFGAVRCIALQGDGKVVFGGEFTTVGSTQRFRVARVSASGTLESFDPKADDMVTSLVVQTDGKIILSGYFTTLQPNGAASATNRRRIARVNADGTLDAFDPFANAPVFGVALQADGKVLICGGFANLQGATVSRGRLARLNNDAATTSLTAPSAAQVLWNRGGASQEVTHVTFELSTDGGTIWTPLGNGARVGTTSNWQLTGLSLPASGSLRARGRTGGGFGNGSAGLLEQVETFSVTLAAEIVVEDPLGTDLADGGPAVDFGTVNLGSASAVKTFTIKNTGGADLINIVVTKGGTHSADIDLNNTSTSMTLAPEGTTSFTVAFAPTMAGPRDAFIQITSSDTDEGTFDIPIIGAGNTLPIAGTSSDSVTTGEMVSVTLPFTSPDADGQTVTVQTINASGGAPFSLGSVTGNTVPVTGAANAAGMGTISFTVSDGNGGTANGSMTVTVNDNDAPVFFNMPGNVTTEATSAAGAVATFTAPTVNDNIGVTSSNASHTSESTFPIGTTVVSFSAQDAAGNTGMAGFSVTVQDTIAPVVDAHANVTVEATSASGATVNYAAATASDAVGVTSITYSQDSGTTFSIGTTQVTITAKDAANNEGTGSFTVTVQDTTGPVISVPANITVSADGPGGTVVNFNVSANDGVDGAVTASATPSSGSTFSIGTTTVNVTAQDSRGNTSNTSFTITVQPSTHANLTALSIAGASLTPIFDPAITSYTASVGNADMSATISATAASGATIQQTPANPVALNVGENTVQVKVTAQDGTTMKTYTLTITRSAADKTKPAVKITVPKGGSVTGAFVLTGTVQENIALESFTVSLNGAHLTLDAPLAFTPGTAVTWTISGVVPENGTNTVLVEAVDVNGNRGAATKTLTFVNNRPELAGTYNTLLVAEGAPTLDNTGIVTVKVAASGTFTGKATLSGVTKSFGGVLKNDGVARFKPTLGETFDVIDKTRNLGALAFTVSSPAGLDGTLSAQGGAVLARCVGKVAPYSSKNPAPAPLLNLLTKGTYAVAFPSKTQTPALPTNTYPQGDGYAALTLNKTGSVSLKGKLVDGTTYSATGALRADATVALFTQLYAKLGAMTGTLAFEDLVDSDVSGADFLWLRPMQPSQKHYPNGWPAGLRIDAVGTKYAKPASFDFGQGAAETLNGNASLVFTDGLLTPAVINPTSIDPATGAVKTIPARGAPYKLKLASATGVLSGSFTHTDTKKTNFNGILLNKGANRGGFGYFLSTPPVGGTGQGGGMSLDPTGP